jgi:hypothetical protein
MVFPTWKRISRTIVTQRDLCGAVAEDAFLFLNGLAPIRAGAMHVGAGQATFTNVADLPPPAHDWTAPPLARVEAARQATAAATPTNSQPIGAQIRKALTRTPPPASKTKAKSP